MEGSHSLSMSLSSLCFLAVTTEKFFHLRLHRSINLDERRPEAFEAFAGIFCVASMPSSLVVWSSI